MLLGKGIDAGGASGGDNIRTKISGSFSFISSAIRLPLLTAYMNGRKKPFLQNLGGLLCNNDKPGVLCAAMNLWRPAG